MALTEDEKSEIEAAVTPVLTSVATMAAVGAITAVAKKLMTTNYKREDLTGDTTLRPTSKEVDINKTETAATETSGKLASNEVTAEEGSVNANSNDANALDNKAGALDTTAKGVQNKAGGLQTKVKGLDLS